MENASKALLIAAAVLVAILIITVGIKIFSSSSDAGKAATDTGTTINDKTKTATDIAISEISGKSAQSNASSNTSGQKIGDVITKDNYGDYIDLGQSVIGTSVTTDDWRILYNDKTGHVYAILADYLPNNNPAVTASGLNVESEKLYDVYSTISKEDLSEKLNSKTAWQTLIPEGLRSSCQVKGATTAGIIMESYNKKYEKNIAYTSVPFLYIDADSSKGIDTLYIPHSNLNYPYGYWLSSNFDYAYTGLWVIICTGQMTGEEYCHREYAVRPVVSLPSSIKVIKTGEVWKIVQ